MGAGSAVTRTLLNTFPTWLLAIVIVGGAVAVSVGGSLLVRRRFPRLHKHGVNDLVGVVIGVLAAVFGILLGFVTISLYESFTDAKATVRSEATEVIQLYNDSRAFEPAAAAAAEREIKSYVATVRFVEWDRMRDGDADSRLGDAHIADLYRVLREYEPDTRARSGVLLGRRDAGQRHRRRASLAPDRRLRADAGRVSRHARARRRAARRVAVSPGHASSDGCTWSWSSPSR